MKKRTALLTAVTVIVFMFAAMWQYGYTAILKTVYPVRYEALIRRYSQENRIDPALVFAVVKNESDFNPRAVSNQGALGLMQLTPETFLWGQSKKRDGIKYAIEDLYDPEINIKYGTVVLAQFLNEFQYDSKTAVAAYHAGRGNVNKWLLDKRYSSDGKTLTAIPYDATRSYVNKVLKSREIYNKLYFKS